MVALATIHCSSLILYTFQITVKIIVLPNVLIMRKITNFNGIVFAIFVIASIALFTACTNQEIITPCLKGHTFGFLGGLFHGFIAPFDLIAMLFRNDVTVYAPNNNGAWYAFGFLIGSGGWGFFGGNRSSKKKG